LEEGGLRPVPRGRSAKKQQQQEERFLFDLGEKWKTIEKVIQEPFWERVPESLLGKGS
jgi:hypothetical protein